MEGYLIRKMDSEELNEYQEPPKDEESENGGDKEKEPMNPKALSHIHNHMMSEILEEVLNNPSVKSQQSLFPKLDEDEFIVGSLSAENGQTLGNITKQ